MRDFAKVWIRCLIPLIAAYLILLTVAELWPRFNPAAGDVIVVATLLAAATTAIRWSGSYLTRTRKDRP